MKPCKHPPCNEPAAAKDLCRRHYYQQRNGKALTMPTSQKTARGEYDRIAEGWRAQGGRCAVCAHARTGMRLHAEENGDVICDVCKIILQTTSDPNLLENVLLYLLDQRAKARAKNRAE